MFKTSITANIDVRFSSHYRKNRHGTKIAEVSIFCDFSNDYEEESIIYYVECRLRANNVIEWEFKDCNSFIQSEVKARYDAKVPKIFESMKNLADDL